MLRIENLQIAGLDPLWVEVRDGECLTLEGPSGSGKTRVLRAIADLDPARGDIFLDGARREEMPGPAWRHRVRYVAAEPGWWTPTPRPALIKSPADRARIVRALDAVGLESDVLDEAVASLSTGQRLRLALLRAVVDEPRALMLDEPTAALDPTSTALVAEFIKYQKLAGRIVLLVAHDSRLISQLADFRFDIAALSRAAAGTPNEVRDTLRTAART